ncbi:MAG: hypothetical protein D6683_14890 [Actinomyces sp.]|nr:MAG: hypothetical protein D6683_14890 [Actinomyces sp.]
MDAYEAVVTKRDIRHYTPDPIPDDLLHKVLQAARMAGSAKNAEANRLIVFRGREVKEALAGCGDYAGWIGSAPVIIGIAAPREALRLFDVGRMAQNMMIVAHAEGLGSCPVTLGHQDRVRAAIGLPDDWEMPMVITLGRPVAEVPDSPLKRRRLPLEELVRHERWS